MTAELVIHPARPYVGEPVVLVHRRNSSRGAQMADTALAHPDVAWRIWSKPDTIAGLRRAANDHLAAIGAGKRVTIHRIEVGGPAQRSGMYEIRLVADVAAVNAAKGVAA